MGAKVSIDPTAQAFTVKQCAVYCGLTVYQTRRVIGEGKLRARRASSRDLIILKTDADAFLASLPVASTTAWALRRMAKVTL